MIDQISGTSDNAALQNNATSLQRKVLKMVKNERMGGYVPKWEVVSTSAQKIEKNLSVAQNSEKGAGFKEALAYQNTNADISTTVQQEFGFGDLIDMVNPLHHVPVVNHVYRSLSGDEIKPIGKIIGGAVFGGPAGAAANLVNVVVEEETGKDLTGNAFAMVVNGEAPHFKSAPADIEKNLTQIARSASTPEEDLPGALLAFADLKKGFSGIRIEKIKAAEGRTAGTITRKVYPHLNDVVTYVREPITQISMRKLLEQE